MPFVMSQRLHGVTKTRQPQELNLSGILLDLKNTNKEIIDFSLFHSHTHSVFFPFLCLPPAGG